MAQKTTLKPYAYPGQVYGSFAGKAAVVVIPATLDTPLIRIYEPPFDDRQYEPPFDDRQYEVPTT